MTGHSSWALLRSVGSRLRTRRDDERGSVAPFVVIVSVGLLLLAGLVIDGGRQLNAKGIAIAYAQEAARAGAQAVNVADPSLDLVDGAAVAAAVDYCRQAQASDSSLVRCVPDVRVVVVNGTPLHAVEVETEVSRSAILLAMIGRQTLTASGIAQARPVSGIDAADDAKLSTLDAPSVAPPGGGGDDEGGGGLPTTSFAPPSPSQIEACTTEEPEDPDESDDPDSPGDDGGDDDGEDDEDATGPDDPGADDEPTSDLSPCPPAADEEVDQR